MLFGKTVSFSSNKEDLHCFKMILFLVKPSPKVVRSPTDAVFGEVSLLLIFNQFLASEKLKTDQSKSNKVLELINEIACSTNDRTPELYNLINVSNIQLDIVNVALWSLLYQKNQISPKIQKWLEQLTKMIIL